MSNRNCVDLHLQFYLLKYEICPPVSTTLAVVRCIYAATSAAMDGVNRSVSRYIVSTNCSSLTDSSIEAMLGLKNPMVFKEVFRFLGFFLGF